MAKKKRSLLIACYKFSDTTENISLISLERKKILDACCAAHSENYSLQRWGEKQLDELAERLAREKDLRIRQAAASNKGAQGRRKIGDATRAKMREAEETGKTPPTSKRNARRLKEKRPNR